MRTPRPGFTLIEVLLVVALGGLLLTAIASLLFSTIQLTTEARTEPHFRTHVHGMVRHLDALLQLGSDIAAETGNASSNRGQDRGNSETQKDGGIQWDEMPGGGVGDDEVLAFSLQGEVLLFNDAEYGHPYSPDVWLRFDQAEGLILRWQSPKLIEEEDREAFRETLLSPLVTKLTYWFYDAEDESWESYEADESFDRSELGLPALLELEFTSKDEVVVKRRILLPANFEEGGTF